VDVPPATGAQRGERLAAGLERLARQRVEVALARRRVWHMDAPHRRLVANEPVRDLRELAVVEQVVLEPEHDLAVVPGEPRVAGAQVRERPILLRPAA
jgi:hypothetical protein